MILIQRNELCHICTKDGRYIRGMSPSKVDESKRFISLVRDHQKVEHRASYQLAMLSELTNEPAFPI